MTDLHDGSASSPNDDPVSPLAQLADLPSPKRPAGSVGTLLDRMLIYARPDQVPVLRPHVNLERSGFVIAGATASRRMKLLAEDGFDGLVLVDPAAYEKHVATVGAPFWSPEDQLLPTSLEDLLDQQLMAGAPAALTPTKFITAGDTDSLKAAARQVKLLRRNDMIFVAPLDISFLDRKFIRQTTAILADADCPVALVLGKQFDPLAQAATRIIPNLRTLAATIELMPMRTDFNAFDLVAHGAFAGAIGTGGSVRHAVEPPQKPMAFNQDPSPSVLVPELMCWWKGNKLAELFGAKEHLAPRCPCEVCATRKLTRFLKRTDKNEAMAHAVAVWSTYAADMLDAPTLRQRAQYWRNVCRNALHHHKLIPAQLKLAKPLKPQKSLEVWAELPPWPTDQP
ncbi:hypothetical protein IOD16_23740 [Saccharothrix sp. 6-C]|uniref:hypothetical protein n=1 Tax=Saccharothrix sp. 6-C TaxID=2781735 RepID=UPI0019179D33|nr:hypothetical protein [Saccharothrix sp. 6-C]QQQ74217.1 hypothetical protein IOD16_23740 [Saccharothrix sp. 6-C]